MENIQTSIHSALVIDHDNDFFSNLNSIFIYYHINIKCINNGIDALKEIEGSTFDCFFIASTLLDVSAVYLIDRIKCIYPSVIVIVMLDNPTVEQVIEFTAYGADNFIIKPFTWESVEKLLTFYNY